MNILIAGVGGQGTVLASKVLAGCGIAKGFTAKTAETIGMAQRGGCVVSHVRFGEKIFSPLIPKGEADVIIAFEPAEAVRVLDYLKKDGTVVVNQRAIKPATTSLSESHYNGTEMIAYLEKQVKHLIVVDGEAGCRKCGSSKVLNFVLIGAAAKSGAIRITPEELFQVIDQRFAPKFRELNKKAVKLA